MGLNETGGGWLVFIMEKPEKHGLVHNGKARKTRPCYSWEILETTRGCSHSGPPDCWRAFQKYCFSSPDFAFCHALILTVIPGRVSGVMVPSAQVFFESVTRSPCHGRLSSKVTFYHSSFKRKVQCSVTLASAVG